MKMTSIVALVAIGSLTLGGCVTAPRALLSSAVASAAADVKAIGSAGAKDLPTACALLAAADAAFKSAELGADQLGTPFAGATVTDEAAAMAGTVAPCANPAAVANPTALITTVLQATAAVTGALAAAKSVAGH